MLVASRFEWMRLSQLLSVILLVGLATHARAQGVTYQVNSAGQVIQATYPNGTVVTYTYDKNGNRLSASAVPDTTPPSAPGPVSDSSLTGTSAVITWTSATDTIAITGYAYQINGGAWSSFSNSDSVDLSGLTPGTTYTIAVEAEDAAGNVGAPSTVTFTMPPSAPGTPTASTITGNSATVSWTAATDSQGVAGYSYQLNGGAWSSFSNVLSVSLTGLSYGTVYTVGVRAEDASGNIGPTATGTFTTGPTTPGTPTASNITGTSATVSWTASTDSQGVSGYSYQVNGGTWSAYSNTESVSLTGLAYGTTYTVGVRSEDPAGNISATATGEFTTLPSAPGTPTASNIAGTSVTLSWAAASDHNGVSGYSYQLNGGTWSAWANALSVNLTGLAYGTSYTVDVRAEDAAGNIGPPSSGNFTTAPSTPGVPSISNITGTSATVSWTAATTGNSPITGYSYQLNGGTWSSFSSALSVSLTGLGYGTAYTVAVRAEDAAGNIGAAASSSFTTAPSAPGTPTASGIGPTSATVSWTAATSAVGVSGYRYSLNGGSSWTTVGTALSVSLSSLSLGTTYQVLTEAENPSGLWGAASSGSFTTLAYYTDAFSMTSGSHTTYMAGPNGVQIPEEIYVGYVPGTGGWGSLSPTKTSTGMTIGYFEGTYQDPTGGGAQNTFFMVSGFSSNPGIGWLQSVSLAGSTLTGASATFSYSSGEALWTWSGSYTVPAQSGTLTVVHK